MGVFPIISGKRLIKVLEKNGFYVVRTNGSHVRLKSENGKITTVPVHGNVDLPKGLLRKIVGHDLEISMDEFRKLLK